MVAARSDRGPDLVDLGPLEAPVGSSGSSSREFLRIGTSLEDAVTRSHLSDGRTVGWYGEPGVVIDAEIDRPVPARLAEAYGAEDFWERWTAAECAAKLADVPIAVWVRERGLVSEGARVETLRLDDLVVSLGRSRPESP